MVRDQALHAIVRDRWDDDDFDYALTTLEPLREMEARIAEENDAGWLVADVHAALLKARPQLALPGTPATRLDLLIMHEVLESREVKSLRQYTVGDRFAAGLATIAMADQLHALLSGRYAEEDLAELGLEEWVGAGVAAKVAMAVRSAATAGQAAIQGYVAAVESWGLTRASVAAMDPLERMEFADRLNTPRLRDIAERYGRIKAGLATADIRAKRGVDDVHGLDRSSDLSRLSEQERTHLALGLAESSFADRWARSQLETVRRESPAAERGGIVFVADASGTMDGARDGWARALGLALLDVATEEERPFRAIVFSTEAHEFTFSSPPTIEERVAFAELTLGGGTDFEVPLSRALEFLEEEYRDTGSVSADVVFASDGLCQVSGEFMQWWSDSRRVLGFRCHGVAIASDPAQLHRVGLFDETIRADRLTDGEDVLTLFEKIVEVPAWK